MAGWGTRSIAALAVVAALAGGLSACGGSGSEADSGSTASTAATNGGSGNGGAGGNGQAGGGQRKESSEGGKEAGKPASVSPLNVSGGGSGQYRVKGGDNSIQDFGEESSESDLEAAAAALHGFLAARAEEDWKAACARLSSSVSEQLEQLAAHAKSGTKGCPAALAVVTPPLPPAARRETTAVDAGSLRIEGDRGFLIYRGGEKTVYAIGMTSEGGAWKVAALAPVPLS